MRWMNSAARFWVASLVSSPRISSTSAMSGTGLKKCMPMKRSGCSVAAASAVIEIEEVLVASTASWRMISVGLRHDAPLDVEILGRGLDDEIHGLELCVLGRCRGSGRARPRDRPP